jgi:uncharacterized protein YjbI with pentapeptide repeats
VSQPLPEVAAPRAPQVIKGQRYTGAQRHLRLTDTIYDSCHFDHVTWIECELSHLHFVNCRFEGNRFEQCALSRLSHERCELLDIAWIDCRQRGISHSGGTIKDALWRGEHLRDSVFAHMEGARWHFDALRSAHVSLVAAAFENLAISAGHWSDSALIEAEFTELHVHSARLENFIVGRSTCRQMSLTNCQGINTRWIEADIEAMTLRDCHLNQAAWSHCTWTQGAFESCHLPIAGFDHASLINVDIRNCELPQALFDSASVVGCDWRGMRAPRISLRLAQLRQVQLADAHLPQLDGRGVVLEDVSLAHCDCRKADLRGQPRTAWSGADTRQARFDIAADEDDRAWRQRVHPGARE